MQSTFAKLATTMLFAMALGPASGCSMTVATDPNAYPFDASKTLALPSGAEVDVVNGFSSPTRTQLEGSMFLDLHEATETAAAIARRELARKGVAVRPGAARTIVLRVSQPSWTHGFAVMGVVLTLEAELGGTTVYPVGEARSGANAMRVCNLALTRSVEALLARPELQTYLAAEPSSR